MTYETKFDRDSQDKKFRGETVIPLGFDRRELRITTSKHPWNPTIDTQARVVQVSEDSRSYSHVIGVAGTGDFSVKLRSNPLRATEKNIRVQHEEALKSVETLFAQALAHYRVPA